MLTFRKSLASIAILCASVAAHAADLTSAQMTTLRAAVCANGSLSPYMSSGDTASLRTALNAEAAPAWVVWRDALTLAAVREVWTWTEVDNLTQARQFQFGQLFADGAVDAGKANIRQGLQDIFSGASLSASRTAITAAAKRNATVAEKALSTGTGTNATPAVLGYSGAISEVDTARLVYRDNGALWGC